MDLCLPDHWETRCDKAFRDDLGPDALPVSRRAICGLRDWRALPAPVALPLHGGRAIRRAPQLVPYHAPAWLREMHPA